MPPAGSRFQARGAITHGLQFCTTEGSTGWELPGRTFLEVLKAQVTNDDCPNAERTQHRSLDTAFSTTFYSLFIFSFSNVNAPMNSLNIQALVENPHLSLSTPLIPTPHPLLPLSLELPSQRPFITFHVSVLPLLSTIIFSVPPPPSWPSDQLPDCVSRKCVSRNHQSSR